MSETHPNLPIVARKVINRMQNGNLAEQVDPFLERTHQFSNVDPLKQIKERDHAC